MMSRDAIREVCPEAVVLMDYEHGEVWVITPRVPTGAAQVQLEELHPLVVQLYAVSETEFERALHDALTPAWLRWLRWLRCRGAEVAVRVLSLHGRAG